jgi:hypothetical protein
MYQHPPLVSLLSSWCFDGLNLKLQLKSWLQHVHLPRRNEPWARESGSGAFSLSVVGGIRLLSTFDVSIFALFWLLASKLAVQRCLFLCGGCLGGWTLLEPHTCRVSLSRFVVAWLPVRSWYPALDVLSFGVRWHHGITLTLTLPNRTLNPNRVLT